ncbi:cell division protein FtsL [Salmonella enterica subsp. enterica]|uniref:Cell division protein FtsL n=1 Tax=Salmonella enterica I TaxID=59201 RepID=A0A3S4HS14_SALET|nr:cell division protein FtsL [Salmonella enterica subsp. enterica]
MISRVTEALSKVKGSIGSNERHALPGVIGDDLLRFGKLPLCLFICIIFNGGDGGHDGAPYSFTHRAA